MINVVWGNAGRTAACPANREPCILAFDWEGCSSYGEQVPERELPNMLLSDHFPFGAERRLWVDDLSCRLRQPCAVGCAEPPVTSIKVRGFHRQRGFAMVEMRQSP